jgi:hypothetical protein
MKNIGQSSIIGLPTNGKSLVSILYEISAGASGNHRKTSADGVAYDSKAIDLTWVNC